MASTIQALVSSTRLDAPELALTLRPHDAGALAAYADRLLAERPTDPAVIHRAATLARQSLAGLALNPRALRILAAESLVTGDLKRADAALDMSESLTRRDVLTQIMLIERSVAKGDLPRTLRSYDVALRTSPTLEPTLFPLLASSSTQAVLAPQIAALLHADPPWAGHFVDWVVNYAPEPSRLITLILAIPRNSVVFDDARRKALVRTLAARRDYRAVDRVYDRFAPGAGKTIDPDFADAGRLPPRDWELGRGDGLVVERTGGSGIAPEIRFRAEAGITVPVVRRLIALPPGHYRVDTIARSDVVDRDARPLWSLSCATSRPPPLGVLPIGDGTDNNLRSSGAVVIPAGCPFQWLRLDLLPASGEGGQRGAVRLISVQRLPA